MHPVRGSPSRRTLVQLTIFTVITARVGAAFAQLYRCLHATSLQLHRVFDVVHGRVDLWLRRRAMCHCCVRGARSSYCVCLGEEGKVL
uniref:Putative secreted protein n=1 Tax=Ixodes ricinus TaxID=34613 RepID=A0A6B0U010_IXORI